MGHNCACGDGSNPPTSVEHPFEGRTWMGGSTKRWWSLVITYLHIFAAFVLREKERPNTFRSYWLHVHFVTWTILIFGYFLRSWICYIYMFLCECSQNECIDIQFTRDIFAKCVFSLIRKRKATTNTHSSSRVRERISLEDKYSVLLKFNYT